MRNILIALSLAALTACQPASKPAAEPNADAETAPIAVEDSEIEIVPAAFTHETGPGVANLLIEEAGGLSPMRLQCAAAPLTLTATGEVSQVALGNMAAPYAISVSGDSFPADLEPGQEGDLAFSVTTPLTADLLSALSGATTARIMVNDNYAFVESAVDAGDEFERFAAACASVAGMTATP